MPEATKLADNSLEYIKITPKRLPQKTKKGKK
ncbi:hypothetical protein LCGC14_2192090 [marine sediment metagenome]|uniref:Uncharacterized protein n=1 Tax=marine sediment metagenome TaxID=412755 RepID=A0A0F9DJB6_9ZZZZ